MDRRCCVVFCICSTFLVSVVILFCIVLGCGRSLFFGLTGCVFFLVADVQLMGNLSSVLYIGVEGNTVFEIFGYGLIAEAN